MALVFGDVKKKRERKQFLLSLYCGWRWHLGKLSAGSYAQSGKICATGRPLLEHLLALDYLLDGEIGCVG
jgi:hypothetical protein